MSMSLQINCDGEECLESEYIDVQIHDRTIDLVGVHDYLADSFGWSFGEYQDEGNNKMVLCKACTAKRETVDA